MEKPQISRFQERKEKREELKEFLPADLQLIYGTDIKPSKWYFGGELAKRRLSEETADKLFFKALDEYNNNKTIETSLFSEVLKNKQEIAQLMIYDQQLQAGLEKFANEGRWYYYAQLLNTMAQLGKATDQQLQAGLKEYANKGEWNLYAQLLNTMAQLGKELPADTDQQLQAGLEECANKGEWYSYVQLLNTMAQLGKINFQNTQYQKINEYIKDQPEEDRSFLLYNISANLALDKNLLKYEKDQYHHWQALRQISLEINKKQTETKQVKNPEKWWQ